MSPNHNPGEWQAELLAYQHQGANNSYEPYSGVTSLFSGDEHVRWPHDREEFLVISEYVLERVSEEDAKDTDEVKD